MLQILAEREFPVTELIPVASERSVGKSVEFNGKTHQVCGMQEAVALKPAIALFSAGSAVSLEWAEQFASAGATVIDNSSAWRMCLGHKLVVPEVNGSVLTAADKIIANPNCSTIQMVMALAPLQREYGIKRVVVSTYQSVSGSGMKAVQQLENERQGIAGERFYPHQIDKNCLPHAGEFDESGYTTEEIKLVNETRKILSDDSIQITATVVRVPVDAGHSEALNVELKKDFVLDEVRQLLQAMPGVTVVDNPQNNQYPMPLDAAGKDEVFVGRLRRDASMPNTLNMWVVSDNLRKGAATNAIQIAEYILKKGFVKTSSKES